MKIYIPNRADPAVLNNLLKVWEASVLTTHYFLEPHDIIAIKADVKQALQTIEILYCCIDDQQSLGFIGIQQNKIEMLFIAPEAQGQGIGKQLVSYAEQNHTIKYVDVNEQNEQALGFYQKLGFDIFSRSDIDGQGRSFPILHLKTATQNNRSRSKNSKRMLFSCLLPQRQRQSLVGQGIKIRHSDT